MYSVSRNHVRMYIRTASLLCIQEIDTRPSPYINPGAIGPTSSATPAGVAKAKTVSKDIWGSEEVVSPQQHDYDDPRPEPE